MNLIICTTPLQSLIANALIQQIGGDFIGIYMVYQDNEKQQYYAKKLQQSCNNMQYIVLKNQDMKAQFQTLSKIKNTLKHLNIYKKNIGNIYIASIDLLFIQYILAKVNYKMLFTFDDGTANLFKTSMYYHDKTNFSKKIFKKIIGIDDNIHTIKQKSVKHYTIFYGQENIIANTEFVQLLIQNKTHTNKKNETARKKILLGQPFNHIMSERAYKNMILYTMEYFGINAFYPHPRETAHLDDSVTVIKTEKIIEDYLIDELLKNDELEFEIYTFTSTAIFSLKNMSRVVTCVVKSGELYSLSKEYEFLEEQGFRILIMDY